MFRKISLVLFLALTLMVWGVFDHRGQAQKAQSAPYPPARLRSLTKEWTRAKDYTKDFLAAMPEDGIGLKPAPKMRSFAEQMSHLAHLNVLFGADIGGLPNLTKGKKLEAVNEY